MSVARQADEFRLDSEGPSNADASVTIIASSAVRSPNLERAQQPRPSLDDRESAEAVKPLSDWLIPTTYRVAYRHLRYVVDRVVAGLLLLASAPIFAVTCVLIRLDSPGPILFRQMRAGKGGQPFTIYKFRTLHVTAPSFSLKVTDDNPLITQVGCFLRRTGLDELPQLWNVLRGDMALIGPRPEQLGLMHLYDRWQRQRLLVKPGITGWWQIHHRDGVPLHLNVDRDLYYIRHQGPWIDCVILAGTFKVILSGAFRHGAPRAEPRESDQRQASVEALNPETL